MGRNGRKWKRIKSLPLLRTPEGRTKRPRHSSEGWNPGEVEGEAPSSRPKCDQMQPNATELKFCHSYALLRVVPNAPVIPAKAGIQARLRVKPPSSRPKWVEMEGNGTEIKVCRSSALLGAVPCVPVVPAKAGTSHPGAWAQPRQPPTNAYSALDARRSSSKRRPSPGASGMTSRPAALICGTSSNSANAHGICSTYWPFGAAASA